jgi:hypothetical protein
VGKRAMLLMALIEFIAGGEQAFSHSRGAAE